MNWYDPKAEAFEKKYGMSRTKATILGLVMFGLFLLVAYVEHPY